MTRGYWVVSTERAPERGLRRLAAYQLGTNQVRHVRVIARRMVLGNAKTRTSRPVVFVHHFETEQAPGGSR